MRKPESPGAAMNGPAVNRLSKGTIEVFSDGRVWVDMEDSEIGYKVASLIAAGMDMEDNDAQKGENN